MKLLAARCFCWRIVRWRRSAWIAIYRTLKQHVGLKYAEIVYNGLWFTPLRASLDAFVASTQEEMTGTVKLALYKGNVGISSRKSEHSLFNADLSSFTMGESYDQKDAAGFIKILALPARARMMNAKARKRQLR